VEKDIETTTEKRPAITKQPLDIGRIGCVCDQSVNSVPTPRLEQCASMVDGFRRSAANDDLCALLEEPAG
jgi:hypothetical protein